ncbi:hypothetical protein DdX_14168 [Ditylenchus destructor]|uniref:Uncharacterized protein n=1 Tax=Ditylenchus destructor TaxID=166010 RepID=A0AAD4MXI5_9BILA|nr:hypothetical protein DdX_14168 [Ditylenchus destructor]
MTSAFSVLGLLLLAFSVLPPARTSKIKEYEQSLKQKGDILFSLDLNVSQSDNPESRSIGDNPIDVSQLIGDLAVLNLLDMAVKYALDPENHAIVTIPQERSLSAKVPVYDLEQIEVLNAVHGFPRNTFIQRDPEVIGNPLLYRGHNIKDINNAFGNKFPQLVNAKQAVIDVKTHTVLFQKLEGFANAYSELNAEVQLVPLFQFVLHNPAGAIVSADATIGVARIDLSGVDPPSLFAVPL